MSRLSASRRKFLKWAGLTGAAALATACGATAAPTTAPTTVAGAATAAPATAAATATATTAVVGAATASPTTVAATATATTAAATEAAATPTLSAEAQATANAVESARATESAIPLEGLPQDPALSMTEDQLLAKMDEDKKKAASEGKTVIEWLSAWGTILSDKTQPHYWLMRDYMQQNPNVFIAYTPASAYTGAFNEVIMMRIASGDPPDVIYHYSSPVAYAARGACLQLDPLMDAHPKLKASALVPNGLAQVQWKGKTWSIPCTMSPSLVFYSEAKLKELGVPTDQDKLPQTWDDLRALSGKMTKWNGDTLAYAGFLPLAGGFTLYGQIASMGGSLWDGEKYTINSAENVDFLKYILSWLDAEYKGSIDKVNASGSWGGLYPGNAMPMGIQGIILDGFWNFAHCPPEFQYVYAKTPTAQKGQTPWNSSWPNMMFIPAKAKHPKEAFDFTAYCTIDGAKWWWNQWADVPSWKDFPADQPSKEHVARVGEEKALAIAKFARVLVNEVVMQWNSPVDDIATDELGRMLDQVLHKVTDPKTAADNAQKAIQAKLDEVSTSG